MSMVRVVVRLGSSFQTCERISARETVVPALRAKQASNALSRAESLHWRPPRWQISPLTQSTTTFNMAKPLATAAVGRVIRLALLLLPAHTNWFCAKMLFTTE